jgi:hypothetical protein
MRLELYKITNSPRVQSLRRQQSKKQLVKRFPAFYGTQRFIIVFAKTRYPIPSATFHSKLVFLL